MRYPFKTFYTLIVSFFEAMIFTIPISLTSKAIGTLLNTKSFDDIVFILGQILIVAIIQATIFFSVSFINEVLAHRVTTDITEDLFTNLQHRSLTYHDKVNIGEIMGRATGDTRNINIGLSPAVRIIISVFAIWLVTIYNAFEVNPIFAAIMAFGFFLFMLATVRYTLSILGLSKRTLEEYAKLADVSVGTFSGIREVKNYVAEPLVKRKFAKKAFDHMRAKITEGEKWAIFYPILILNVFSVGAIAGVVFYSSINPQILPIERVVLLVGLLLLARGISNELHWTSWMTITMIAASQRVYNIIHSPDPGAFEDGSIDYGGKPATVEFTNVFFRYNPQEPDVLKDVTFRIDENQTVVIIGTPGSGKTTLTKLIQRLYLPTKGTIRIGGRDIQEYTNDSLRKHIATVEQDIFLFNDTIFENIRFGKPDATLDEVIEVAKLAQAHEFIMELPQKYDNLVGEGGVRLSGGQAQRIAIARALLMDPTILIMDDGASALDTRTELKIQKAIEEVLKTRTTILTTHRLSIIAKADVILIFDRGKLVGQGNHAMLIRTNKFYRRLFERHYELPPMEVFGK